MTERYQFRDNHQTYKVASEIVAQELLALHDSGGLTAARVVEVAKPKDAPLHAEFEWNNVVAGHEYRLIQGRNLIRAVVIVTERSGDEQAPAQPLFVHVPNPAQGEGRYVPLQTVMQDIAEYGRALDEAQRRLDSAERAVQELRRLAEGRGGAAEALAIASQGFSAVREALAILRG